jgi:hypothetical protein
MLRDAVREIIGSDVVFPKIIWVISPPGLVNGGHGPVTDMTSTGDIFSSPVVATV